MPLSPGAKGVLKAIGWSIAFVVLVGITAGLLGLGLAVLMQGSSQAALAWLGTLGPGPMLLQSGTLIASTLLFTWLLGIRAVGLTTTELRYHGAGPGGPGFAKGLGAGALSAIGALCIAVVAGGAEWVPDGGSAGDYLRQVLKTILVLTPAALSEELLFRGAPLVVLARVLGRGGAIVAVAVPFALAHLANPSVSATGIGNIALAGVFLGLAFYAPGGIWTAFGAHLGWNATLASLDAPVSGIPFSIPLLDYHAGDPTWLTGGRFGPEGGLAATVALTAAVVVAVRWAAKGTS